MLGTLLAFSRAYILASILDNTKYLTFKFKFTFKVESTFIFVAINL